MEVLMGIFLKACVAVVVGVICLVGLILYSKKKDREEAQNGAAGKSQTDSGHMTCSGDFSKCFSHCGAENIKQQQKQ